MPVCDDVVEGPDPNKIQTASFDPNELTWNIDRLDERQLPLDGQFCPAADGIYICILLTLAIYLA